MGIIHSDPDEPPPLYDTEKIECAQCHATKIVRCINVGADAFAARDLPAEWIVFDAYPPGDMGLHFACSEACLRAYWEERNR